MSRLKRKIAKLGLTEEEAFTMLQDSCLIADECTCLEDIYVFDAIKAERWLEESTNKDSLKV